MKFFNAPRVGRNEHDHLAREALSQINDHRLWATAFNLPDVFVGAAGSATRVMTWTVNKPDGSPAYPSTTPNGQSPLGAVHRALAPTTAIIPEVGWYMTFDRTAIYAPIVFVQRGSSSGICELLLDGVPLMRTSSVTTLDLWTTADNTSVAQEFLDVQISRGEHLLTLRGTGAKNASSSAYDLSVGGIAMAGSTES